MGIIYDDNPTREVPKHPVDYYKLNANKHYMTHYSNYLTLQFMQRSETRAREKAQVTKELGTAERKCQYWRRHPNFREEEVIPEIQKLRKQWRMGDGSIFPLP
jgi:hypothetical protein